MSTLQVEKKRHTPPDKSATYNGGTTADLKIRRRMCTARFNRNTAAHLRKLAVLPPNSGALSDECYGRGTPFFFRGSSGEELFILYLVP